MKQTFVRTYLNRISVIHSREILFIIALIEALRNSGNTNIFHSFPSLIAEIIAKNNFQ